MSEALVVGLVLALTELSVRLGMQIVRSREHERRITTLEKNYDTVHAALRELKRLITDGVT